MGKGGIIKTGGKRILILNWYDKRHPKSGGAEVYLEEVAKELSLLGHEVHWFASSFSGNTPHELVEGITIERFHQSYLINLVSLWRLFKERSRFDLVIDATNKLPYLTSIFFRSKSLPLFLHINDQIFTKEFGQIFGRLGRWFERQMVKTYRRLKVVAISKSTASDLEKLGLSQEQVVIAVPGVKTDLYRPGKKSDYPLIVSVNRLRRYKNLDILIKSFKAVNRSIPKARLVIMGSGPDYARLVRLIHKFKLEQSVRLTGFVSEREKINWLQKAWIHVNPSTKEGWGLNVIDAAACGTPSVGSDVAGLRDSIQDGATGWLVPVGAESALSRKLIKVLKDHQLRRQIGKRCLGWASQFSWAQTARMFDEVISSR